jgi:hypothetical protein
MNMDSKLILYFALLFNDISFAQSPLHSVPPPPPGPALPGENKGKIETYWLAPYVRASEGFGGSTVTWFAKDGRVKRQAAVSGFEPGFVNRIGHGETVQGVNEDWEISLPPEPANNQSGYITSTPDSRVFIHEYHPKGGQVALDIYLHGKLANTVGPFFEYQGTDVALNDDGSAGLLIWKDESRTRVQIVVINTNGAVMSRTDCDAPGTSRIVAPGGCLLPANIQLPDIGPNAWCAGWIPGTHKSLFKTSVGFETNRFHLIDRDTGKQLWDIPCPGGGELLAVGLTSKFIIFAVAELYGSGPWRGSQWGFLNGKKDWIRAFYAVNTGDGQIAARWQESYPRRYCDSDYGHFLWLNDNLFYVAPDEFTKLNFEDIAAKKNGWK